MGLGLKKLVQATGETSAELTPKGSGPVLLDERTYVFSDEYDAGPEPATVGGSVRWARSRDYQSITVEMTCKLPSRPTVAHMAARTEVAYAFMYEALNQQLPTVRALIQALNMQPVELPTVKTDMTEELRPILQAVHRALHPNEKP